jgi:hypothetical protein
MTPRRVIIAGAIAHHPLGGGGNAWAFLQYVLGFRALGIETLYVEHLAPAECYDDDWQPVLFPQSANARFLADVAARFDLTEAVALLERDGEQHVGLSHRELRRWARDADLIVNLSGRFHMPDVLAAPRRRLYIDLDPGFTQIWQQQYGVDMNLRGHDAYVSVGLGLASDDCPIPDCGLRWQSTLPPVVLSQWQTAVAPGAKYTTVADWRGYSPVEWDGVWYGQKAQEFLAIIDLPQRTQAPLELCLAIHGDEPDRSALREHGWGLVDPRTRCASPDAYRDYVWGSRAEFTAAKHGYVAGRTGWFSDRSACYLAAGRPVVLQDTGFSRHLPTGLGLLSFHDLESAVAAVSAVDRDYQAHARAASRLAAEFFDSARVLPRLLELSGL